MMPRRSMSLPATLPLRSTSMPCAPKKAGSIARACGVAACGFTNTTATFAEALRRRRAGRPPRCPKHARACRKEKDFPLMRPIGREWLDPHCGRLQRHASRRRERSGADPVGSSRAPMLEGLTYYVRVSTKRGRQRGWQQVPTITQDQLESCSHPVLVPLPVGA